MAVPCVVAFSKLSEDQLRHSYPAPALAACLHGMYECGYYDQGVFDRVGRVLIERLGDCSVADLKTVLLVWWYGGAGKCVGVG